jgi:ribosomal protein S18 acetylase RimI-like enzyme
MTGFEVIYSDKILYADQVSEILKTCSSEFVPPLTERKSTRQNKFGKEIDKGGSIEAYLLSLLSQHFVYALSNEQVIGFLSFYENNHHQFLPQPNLYVTTICVLPEKRRSGVATSLYDALENLAPKFEGLINPRNSDYISSRGVLQDNQIYLTTRTWSGNDSHIKLLQKRDFELIHTIENDRGPGVDTVYFAKFILLVSKRSNNTNLSECVSLHTLEENE